MNDINCLISYPRSGNTLIRFLIEYITERIVVDYNEKIPDSAIKYLSPDGIDIVPKNPPILRKFHLVDSKLNEKSKIGKSKINLIIRDYYECILSHSKRGCRKTLSEQINDYCDLIRYYDESENKETLIYYEDIIDVEKQPEVIKTLLDNNGIDTIPNWDSYLKNILFLNKKSKDGYIKIYKTVEKEYENKSLYYKEIKSNLGEILFEKYLSRYE